MSYGNSEIDSLVAAGLKSYALKSYEDATENLGKACGLYSSSNDGKEDPSLLFLYGRALFRVAVTQSEVLGESTAGSERGTPAVGSESDKGDNKKNGLFKFSGEDEQEEEEEEEEEDAGEEEEDRENEEAEEEQTDFEVAWEILDLARKLFDDEVATLERSDKEKNASQIKELRIKLADTYDILGEISLESENFPQAVQDLKVSLDCRKQLYPEASTLISEAHYKLSLAYEFDVENDESKRKAIDEMKSALDSVKLRIKLSGEDDKELVADLETRLQELEQANDAVSSDEKRAVIEGILGANGTGATATPGSSLTNVSSSAPSPASSILKEAVLSSVSQANDISSLVRKRPDKKRPTTPGNSSEPKSKRSKE